jgi:hypothetical protein
LHLFAHVRRSGVALRSLISANLDCVVTLNQSLDDVEELCVWSEAVTLRYATEGGFKLVEVLIKVEIFFLDDVGDLAGCGGCDVEFDEDYYCIDDAYRFIVLMGF